jgi:D-glycero-D-manno-heptose 1,7-bisphosphate phosphatase
MTRKAFFVDRDGVLNEMVYDANHGLLDSPRRPEQVLLKTGAGCFLRAIRDLGYRIVVVTNQPGIAKGTLTLDELDAVNARLSALLAAEGGTWDALYYCPHHPTGGSEAVCRPEYVKDCDCRKPRPGLILRAADELRIDLASSWMMGDGIVDVQAGMAAGLKTILLSPLKMEMLSRYIETTGSAPDYPAPDFTTAIRVIRAS